MKATLEFNLPEDREEHRLACAAGEMAAAIQEADSNMRGWLKHGHTFTSIEEAITACRGAICDAVNLTRGE